tara:strand:- start:49 stop:954 length:906 start_codon:yes stop_codon:yes gene_type:complete
MKQFGGYINKNFLRKKKINNKFFTVNGRSSFEIILRILQPKKIYLPFYICKEIIDILKKNKIDFEFYEIDRSLNIKKKIKTKKNENVLVVNYFGLSNIKRDKNNIYDFSLALFNLKNEISPGFNSLRKFINTGYGSFLNIDKINNDYLQKKPPRNVLKSAKTFKQFQLNEKKQKIDRNIYLSKYLNENILTTDFVKIKKRRATNYKIYHKYLNKINILKLPTNSKGPLYYPLLVNNGCDVIKRLKKIKIYTPVLWSHILKNKEPKYNLEKNLSKNCIFLPLDQRYQKKNIEYIIKRLFENF